MEHNLQNKVKSFFKLAVKIYKRFLSTKGQLRIAKSVRRECGLDVAERYRFQKAKKTRWLFIYPLSAALLAAGFFERILVALVSSKFDSPTGLTIFQNINLRLGVGVATLLSVYAIAAILYFLHRASICVRGVRRVEKIHFSVFSRRSSVFFASGLIVALVGIGVNSLAFKILGINWISWSIAFIPQAIFLCLILSWSPSERDFYKKFYTVDSAQVLTKLKIFHGGVSGSIVLALILALYFSGILINASRYI